MREGLDELVAVDFLLEISGEEIWRVIAVTEVMMVQESYRVVVVRVVICSTVWESCSTVSNRKNTAESGDCWWYLQLDVTEIMAFSDEFLWSR